MSDFYQTGVVATLHRLGQRRIEITAAARLTANI